jgi:multidrug efflux pump subunit AcrA (membrane-fusion protein)
MMVEANEKETEEQLPTLEDIMRELPIADEHKQALTNLFTNLATQVVESNQKLAAMEATINELNTKANEATAKAYEGLSADQRYQIEMARAAAPAQAAQTQMISAMLGASRNPGGGFEGLVKSAESLNSLRNFLIPPATPLQVAQEKAQIAQMLAQTRLMDKITGRAANKFADTISDDLLKGEGEEE